MPRRRSFNAPHRNSTLAKCADDPELRKRYDEWRAASDQDMHAMNRWARQDFESKPGREVGVIKVRGRERKEQT